MSLTSDLEQTQKRHCLLACRFLYLQQSVKFSKVENMFLQILPTCPIRHHTV